MKHLISDPISAHWCRQTAKLLHTKLDKLFYILNAAHEELGACHDYTKALEAYVRASAKREAGASVQVPADSDEARQDLQVPGVSPEAHSLVDSMPVLEAASPPLIASKQLSFEWRNDDET